MGRNSKVDKKKPSRAEGKGRVRRGRPKVCLFCAEHAEWVDYKDLNVLRRFVNDRGRIKARGATGTCTQHQRDVAVAIKTARELALLPYTVRTLAPAAGERRSGARRDLPRPPESVEIPTDTAAASDPAEATAASDAASPAGEANPLVA